MSKSAMLFHTSALISVFAVVAPFAWAGPENGVVTRGTAGIVQLGSTTTINQSSNRAVIRWDKFNVDTHERVQFVQPSRNAVTVNRIRDNDPSRINGSIKSNGKIVLINPNGILFGASAKVDVGGLIATTSDLEDDDAFMAGGTIKFTKPGKADAKIINDGDITVRDAGLVGLVAPHVENNGTINAKLGKVQLASGDIHTIDFAGDGLIKIEVSDQVMSQSVKNTGKIIADGGEVLITAAQARHAVDALIVNTGTIRANTHKTHKGKVTLSTKGLEKSATPAKGVIENSGMILAKGDDANEKGGLITVLADEIKLTDNARLDVSGDIGGGTILVGGNYQGGSGLPTSHHVFVGQDVILNASGRRRGNGGTVILWSDDTTRFHGHIDASGVTHGGFIEISGKDYLDFTGSIDLHALNGKSGTLLLDPTNITISAGGNANVGGASPFTPTGDDVTSVLNIATLQAALASGNVIVQTRATGAQAGNITVDAGITWTSGSTLTLDAHNMIVVNQAISGGGLTMIAGGDIQLNNTIAGTGTLTIQQRADNITLGLGNSAVGTVNLTATEIGRITDGWADIVIGRKTATAAMDVRAVTWNDNLTLQSGLGVINVNGIQTLGANNLTFLADGDIAFAATANLIAGSGTLTIQQVSANTNISLGGGTGGITLSATEIGRLADGWSKIIIGRTDGTGIVTMGVATWKDELNIQSGSGLINVTGVQTLGANNLRFVTDTDITFAAIANILYGQGALSFTQVSANTGIGLGDGQTGALNLTTTEITNIRDGWSSITFGRTDGTAAINIGTSSWKDNLTLQTGSGVININNAVTMGTQNLNLSTNGAVVSGSGTLSLTSGNFVVTTNGGAVNLGGAITQSTGATTITSSNGAVTIGGGITKTSGNVAINSGTGLLTVNGAISTGTGSASFTTDSNIAINAALSGSGTLTFAQADAGTSMAIGDGQIGTLLIDSTELGRIADTWGNRAFGRTDGTNTVNVAGGLNWVDSLTLQSGTGVITINGAQTLNANNLVIRTDANVAILGALSGTGTFALVQSNANTSMGIGDGQTGTIHLTDDERDFILDGWSTRTFGRTDGTGALNVGATTWMDALVLRSGTGVITLDTQSMGANNLTISTGSNLTLNGNVTGTQYLVITSAITDTSIGLGTSQAGTLQLDDTELSRLGSTWRGITVGGSTLTGDINVAGRTWADPLTLRTIGAININGATAMGSNDLNIYTDSNFDLHGALTGAGKLMITGNTGATTIAVGSGQSGTIQLLDAELDRIMNGWNTITIGSTGSSNTTVVTGAMNIGERFWDDNLIFATRGTMIIHGSQTMSNNSLTLITSSNIEIDASISGTGTLSIYSADNATSIGVGTGQGGTLSLSDTELDFLADGWANVVIGSTAMTGAMNIKGRTWADSMDFRTNSGALNINGAMNMGTNNLVIRTNTDLVINQYLAGTGTLSILTSGTATTNTMAIGDTQTGQLKISNAELAYLVDGWNLISFGNSGSSGALNVGAYTWNDSVAFRSGTGIVTINGAQNVGANNLTITGNADIVINHALTGTGVLTIAQSSATVGLGIGTGQAGAVSINDTELGRLTDGWSNIIFGTTATTSSTYAANNIGAYAWNDNVTFRSYGNVININGVQTMGANNLTFQTDANLALNASGNLSGSGTLTIQGLNTTTSMGIGGTGTLNLTEAELLRINDGWGDIIFGRTDATGTMNIASRTWNDNVTFRTGSGTMTIAGANMGSNNLAFITNSNLALNGNLNGTGKLTIKTASGLTAMAVGTGQGSTGLQLSDTELARITDGWSNVTMGGTEIFGNINIGAENWLNPMTFITQGNITLNGDQTTTETSGTTFTFVTTAGAFINNAGSDAINPGGGRYLVYSVDEARDTLGGLVRSTILSNKPYDSYGPGSVVESGNVFLYSGIIAKVLFLLINDVDKVYGDTLPTFSYTYINGLQNGDLLQDILLGASYNAVGASILDDAGMTRTITGSFTTGSGYTVNVINGTMTVTKAVLTVEADSDTRQYGLANPELTVSYSGFKNGQDVSFLDTEATATTTATNLSNVGNYVITASGATADNYTFVYVDGHLDITKANLTVTSQNATREYGSAAPTYNFTYTGFRNGDTVSVIDTQANGSTSATNLSNVGTYGINGSGALDNNYSFTYVNSGQLSITKATVTATTQNASRVYGDANPALNVVYTGFKNGETSAVLDTGATVSTVANQLSNVGVYDITATGAFDNNYTVVYNDAGKLTIGKATLTATTQNASRIYGDANPTFNVVYTGFKNGETSTVIDSGATISTVANQLSDVGTYGINGSGASDNNYDFTYVNSGQLSITKATITATTQNASRVYGDANPIFNIVYTGFKNGEDGSVINVAANLTSGTNALSNVGTYTISGSGASDNNYDFTYVNSGQLSITKATVTATTQNASRVYGDTNPTLNVVYTGFKNGETSAVLDTGATVSTIANQLSDVGVYDITATGAFDNNYIVVYNDAGKLTIGKATLTATTQNASRIYGDANPTLNVVYTGFKNGQDSLVLDNGATVATTATVLSDVGVYDITASGAFDNNYTVVYNDAGKLTIGKATLTATTQNATRVYGDANPTLNIVYTGFKNGEDTSVINVIANVTSGTNVLSNVGTYMISGSSASDNNYDFTYVNSGQLSITKATVTATTQNASRVYGDANPTLNIVYTGFKNGQNSSVLDTGATVSTVATQLSDVGVYDITASGAFDNNYTVVYNDTGKLAIGKATLIATTQNASRVYGDANPALNVVYTGFKNGDTNVVLDTGATVSTLADDFSNVGQYNVTATGAFDNNYTFVYNDTGKLTIGKATLTATTQNATRVYGDANPTFNIIYTGFKNSEDASVINTTANLTSGTNTLSNVGSYTITGSGASDNNYDFTYVNSGQLSVTKALLIAKAQNATRVYGDTNPTFGVVYTGFKNGQNSSVIDVKANASSTADEHSHIGDYTVTAAGASDGNYDFSYMDGTLTINKASVIVSAQNATRVYGDANPGFTVSYAGFKNGENQSILTALATASSAADVTSNVGNYAITASGAAANNYDFTYTNGHLNVSKAVLQVTAQNATREQYQADPVFTATYTGFKNGEDISVINNLANLSSNADLLSPAGVYSINAYGASDNNYSFIYTPGVLMLTVGLTPPPVIPAAPTSNIPNVINGAFNGNTISQIGFFNEKQNTLNLRSSVPYVRHEISQNDNVDIIIIPDLDDYAHSQRNVSFIIAMTERLEKFFSRKSLSD